MANQFIMLFQGEPKLLKALPRILVAYVLCSQLSGSINDSLLGSLYLTLLSPLPAKTIRDLLAMLLGQAHLVSFLFFITLSLPSSSRISSLRAGNGCGGLPQSQPLWSLSISA